MADVLISYDHNDEAGAAALAKETERLGFTVWWDRKLIGGTRWAKVILEQLNAAHAVLVIWSRHSVHSEFVEDEARRALAAGKLIPLRTKDVEIGQIPLGFGGYQILALGDIAGIGEAIRSLGLGYYKRGKEYYKNRDYNRATLDFSKAIRLNSRHRQA